MKKTFSIILTSLILIFVLAPVASAQNEACDELRRQFEQSGGTEVINNLPKYCTIGAVYTRIINMALAAIGVVAVGAGVYGGYLYMISRGDEKTAARGKTILLYAAIGVVVVLGAAALVNIVVQLAVNNRVF